jgi:GTP-binding protein YchF
MEVGIVGLPNVGKSSLFNALTGAGVAAENFPFTTIEPNVGIVPLPDERLDKLVEVNKSKKSVPAGIRFVDIAGLVKGASQGEGLGNKFLSHVRAVDAIAHVVRFFEDDNVVNVQGELDPLGASEVIETELLLADMQLAEKALERTTKLAKAGDKVFKEKVEVLKEVLEAFNNGQTARTLKIDPELIKEYQFMTAKPLLYVANTNEDGAPEDLMNALKDIAAKQGAQVIALCTKLEAEILELPDDEREIYYEEAGITSPGLSRLAKAGRDLLNLVCFFTSGEQETRAWLIPKETKAPKAAGKIHTDIERGFIRAEIYKYKDLLEHGSEQALQSKGLVSLEGKDYVMEEGDVVHFRFSV